MNIKSKTSNQFRLKVSSNGYVTNHSSLRRSRFLYARLSLRCTRTKKKYQGFFNKCKKIY